MTAPAPTCRSWPLALSGLWLLTFAAALLTNPGRLDITDGQTRYAVAESLHDHGDVQVRDPRAMFAVCGGRGGREYAAYRLPHSLLGAAAIAAADATGPPTEGRRHTFFLGLSGAAGATVAVLFAAWFRRDGLSPRAAVGWAAAGFFCTPVWYYSTSTFDDIFGTATVLAALLAARAGAGRGPGWAAAAGGLVGLAFHWKPPLAAFALPAVALVDVPAAGRWVRLRRAGVVAAGVAAGLASEAAYERYKFPTGLPSAMSRVPLRVWPNPLDHLNPSPVPGVVSLAVSPGCGAVWYAPAAVFLGGYGLAGLWRRDRGTAGAVVVAGGAFVGFVGWLFYFKGDIGWGPRYLTPVLAVGWLYAPGGAARVGRPGAAGLLAAGAAVQVLGLSVDPHRLYAVRDAGGGFYVGRPWAYFDPALAHLPNRFGELAAVARGGGDPADPVTPDAPTYGFPLLVWPEAPMLRYRAIHAPRPWWGWMPLLPPAARPFDLAATAAGLGLAAAVGAGLMAAGVRCGGPPAGGAEGGQEG